MEITQRQKAELKDNNGMLLHRSTYLKLSLREEVAVTPINIYIVGRESLRMTVEAEVERRSMNVDNNKKKTNLKL